MKSVPRLTPEIVMTLMRQKTKKFYIPEEVRNQFGYKEWLQNRRSSVGLVTYDHLWETMSEASLKFLKHLDKRKLLLKFYRTYEKYTQDNSTNNS